jgi:amino acid adenylation domain-containing protein
VTLSSAQRGLWALDQLARGIPIYNLAFAYRLRGRLDTERLRAALARAAERHEVLRTSVAEEEGSPVPRVRPPDAFAVPDADLSDLPEGRRDAEALRAAAAEADRPFDLARELPFRARLVRLAEADHVLSVTFHRLAADEVAAHRVLQEVARDYAGEDVSPARIGYADVARRQAGALRGEDLDLVVAYWRKTLRGAPSRLRLPVDRPAPPVPAFKGAAVDVALPPDLLPAGAEAEPVVAASLIAVLRRYTDEDDLVVGWTVDGRTPQTADVIGTFADVLPLRVDVTDDPSFAELTARAGAALDALKRHRHLPFERLVEELRPARGVGGAPLFQVAAGVYGAPSTELLDLHGVEVEPLPLEVSTARFDLFLGVELAPAGPAARFELSTDVFDPATIARLGRHWVNLLRAAAAAPDVPLSRLDLMDPEERRRTVAMFGREAAGDGVPLVHEAVAARAAEAPGAIAVIAGGEELTYAELDRRAAAVAAELAAHGVARGSVVGLLTGRDAWMIPRMLGILRAGCAYLPLDASYPVERLAFVLEDSGAAALTGDARPPGLRIPDGVAVVDGTGARRDAQPSGVGPKDAAYVIYTSGSTGQPKGVTVEHGSLARFAVTVAAELGLTERDRVLQFASLSFDTAVEEIWPALTRGAAVVLRDPYPWSPEELRDKVAEHGITVLDLPTAYWHELAGACAEGIDVRAAPSLRLVVVGGEAMSSHRTRSWRATEPRAVRLLNTYGPTEATVTATAFDVVANEAGPVVPIGRPLPGCHTYVLDRDLEPVPAGLTGELFVGGSGVARGYLGRPALTAERFVPDPFSDTPGARMYATGDLVRLRRDGILEFAGRRDDQVKIRGFRVEPGEVEAVLARHPGLTAAAVVATTEDPPRLAGYLVAAPDSSPEPEPVRDWLRERVPEHLVPSSLSVLDALPLTPGGKVDRAALAALRPGAPQRKAAAPRTPAEQVLASIWQKLLGLEGVGVDESFFDLGGHSLLATQLVSRIRHDFGVALPLRTVFEWPTIAGLAAVIERSAGAAEEYDELPLEPVERSGDLPLSFAQQRLWFVDQFKPGSADYVIAARAELRGPLDGSALRAALTSLARRHEALRTTFPSAGGEARQAVSPDAHVELDVVDLARVDPGDRAGAAAAAVEREAARPFDLATGPLWRTALVRLADDHHFFVTCMHHIVSDGWSLGIFASELSELYNAHVEEREPRLAPLEVSYADFAVWQRRWFQGEELERQLAYWKTQLEGAPAVLELPTDRPRPPVQSFDGATVGFTFDRELSQGIERLARTHEVTPFMVTLAAFKVLLHRYTGATDVVVGSPIAGRNRSEIEGLIGFFVNTLVLRTDLSGDPTFTELLERVSEVALGAYAHQDLPFEKLVEELGIDRDLAHSPAIQVMFVLQNTPPGHLTLTGVEPTLLDAPTNEVSVDATLDLTETPGGLVAKLVYNADLFDRPTVEALLGHYRTLLSEAVNDADVPLSRLSMLAPGERRTIVEGFNPPATPFPADARVHELFERVALERGGAPAVAYAGEALTYAELNARANRLARHLVALGVRRGDLVAISLDRGLDLVVAMLAACKAGGAYLPLDPENPRRRTAFMLEDAEARVLVTAGDPAAVPVPGHVLSLDRDAQEIAARPATDLGVPGSSDDVAYAIYTSGSTGTPKGICIPHRAIARLVLDTDYVKLGPHSVIAQVSNASFDAATFEIWGALLNGGVVAGIAKEVVLDARRLRGALDADGVDTMFLTTALFNGLVAEDPALFRGMDTVMFGGEAADAQLVRRCLEGEPPGRLLHVYGPTEATTFATWHHVERVPADATTVPIGRPIANTKVHVLDPALNPVPVGVPGEIHIGGPGLATGYLNRPELTKEPFVPDPFSDDPGALLYRTGDLARYLPSGEIEFLARIDSQVKIRGFRVELGEIESVLAEHPAVAEAVVTAIGVAPTDKRLVAYVVDPEAALDLAALRRFLSERVPVYMVPSDFVRLEALPLNANGKVDRRALPAPDPARLGPAEDRVEPRNATEERLARIWAELLGARPLGVHDGFFEIGGHSLLATQMVSRIRDAFGVELELRAVFEAPTIARLAPLVEAAPRADTGSVPQLRALPRT